MGRRSASMSNMILNGSVTQPCSSRSPPVAYPLATPSVPARKAHAQGCRGLIQVARAAVAEVEELLEQDWESVSDINTEAGASLYAQFDALLEETLLDYELGERVPGVVVAVDEKGAFVDVGGKSPAYLPAEEYTSFKLPDVSKCIKVGIQRNFQVIQKFKVPRGKKHALTVSLKEVESDASWKRLEQLGKEGLSEDGVVTGNNGGGIFVDIMGIGAFCPGSHVPQEQKVDGGLEGLLGKTLNFTVLEADKPRLVLSARSNGGLLQDASQYKIGDVVEGTVQSVQLYGAFINIGGGVSGLLHVSQISHERITNVMDVLRIGNKVKVMVMAMDAERGRLSFSTRKLEPEPGDMLKNPHKVFDNADRMAEEWRQRVAEADADFGPGSSGEDL